MALIVEDGTGKADANSYASLQDATDYFADRGETVKITEADMILGTEYLDTVFGPSYKGEVKTQTQALLFPRTYFVSNTGKIVDGTIPSELHVSLYQAAKLSSEGVALVTGPTAESQLSGFTKSVDGVVSKSESYFAPVNRSQSAAIGTYMRPLIKGNGFQGTAVRG